MPAGTNITQELIALRDLSVGELQQRWAELFGEPTKARHKEYLIKRIAWRLQANAEGGLSERALRRAAELANDADLRLSAPKLKKAPTNQQVVSVVGRKSNRSRLPRPGTVIRRPYKDQTLEVTVRADGFEYLGEKFPSLSAVAKRITGSHCNGFHFFRLTQPKGAR